MTISRTNTHQPMVEEIAACDRNYFQHLLDEAKDPMMIAYYQAWIGKFS